MGPDTVLSENSSVTLMITVALQKQYRDTEDNADWTAPRCDSHGGQIVTQLHCRLSRRTLEIDLLTQNNGK